MTKLCKKCSKETYSTSSLCYSHLKEKEREQEYHEEFTLNNPAMG